MEKKTAVKLLKDVAKSYPTSEWLDKETLQTFALDMQGVSYRTTIELIDEPDGVIAISSLKFPSPILSHRKFDKGMKKFLKMMSKQSKFEIRYLAPHLLVMGGHSKEGTTVDEVRELSEATFEIANNCFSGMLEFIDG